MYTDKIVSITGTGDRVAISFEGQEHAHFVNAAWLGRQLGTSVVYREFLQAFIGTTCSWLDSQVLEPNESYESLDPEGKVFDTNNSTSTSLDLFGLKVTPDMSLLAKAAELVASLSKIQGAGLAPMDVAKAKKSKRKRASFANDVAVAEIVEETPAEEPAEE